jgi:hypothetical protein
MPYLYGLAPQDAPLMNSARLPEARASVPKMQRNMDIAQQYFGKFDNITVTMLLSFQAKKRSNIRGGIHEGHLDQRQLFVLWDCVHSVQ